MAEKKQYRVAVVGGAGQWGNMYLRAYAQHPDCEVIALVDTARDRRQAFADEYGIKVVLDTLDDLLAVETPDIVSMILPVGQAHGAVIACAQAGVRVVSCEKPIAASLAQADEMVRVCRERGVGFGCGTAYWEVPNLLETVEWVRAGNIGTLTGASIPGGLPGEVSGSGCVQFTMMRALTGMEVEWVEGWTLPPEEVYPPPPGGSPDDVDCPAYGRLGLSGGIVCEIPQPGRVPCRVAVSGENGHVWLNGPRSVLIQGRGAESTPVYPEFLLAGAPRDMFPLVVERLMNACGSGEEVLCSGHDYRQALEIAVALKLSARRGHERVYLPLEDRSLRVYPRPWRLLGRDVTG